MSTPAAPAGTETGPVNKLAAAAIVLAAIAASGFFLSVGVLAVFAAGAGHVALGQIKRSGERGRGLALAALGIGYAVATAALFSILSYLPAGIQQLAG